MAKTYELKITNFSGGMTNESREENTIYSQLIKNLDAHTYRKKLVPSKSSESGDNAPTTSLKKNFCLAANDAGSSYPVDYRVYALGIQSPGDPPVPGTSIEILNKNLTDDGSSPTSDLRNNVWSSTANNQGNAGLSTNDTLFFIYYPTVKLIFGARNGTHIWTYDPSGSAAFADYLAVTYSLPFTQALIHSKDDVLYVAWGNNVLSKNGAAAFINPALQIPSTYQITSLAEYGDFLAIAASPLSKKGKSVVYLWDRDSTLATISQVIDWGSGVLQVLEEVDGVLVGISYLEQGANASSIVFRAYTGGRAEVFKQFQNEVGYTAGDLKQNKQKLDGFLYFLMTITLNGVKQQGLWKLGRISPDLPLSLTLDRTPNNDTALVSGNLYGFIVVNDYTFIAYDSSGVHAVSKTDDTDTYTASGVYETVILNFGDSSKNKSVIGTTVMTEPLPSGGQVILKYRKDEETSFTTIFTHTTANSLSHGTTAGLPKKFKEITFRIETTGNAVITGLSCKVEETEQDSTY